MVTQGIEASRVDALAGLLEEIADAHGELLGAIDSKIEAMKSADTERIRAAMLKERDIVVRINEREGLRRQLTVNLARPFGISADRARTLSARQLSDRFAGVNGERIERAVETMRGLTDQIAQRNHVAQLISQNMLRHMKIIFASMTAPAGGVGYSQVGDTQVAAGDRIFDLVG